MKRVLKITGFVLVSIVCLLLAGLLALQTGPVKDAVRSRVEKAASEALKLKVSIGALDGNFLRTIVLENLRVADDEGMLLELKRLSVRYSLPALLDKTILVRSLDVEAVSVFLRKEADGTWNVQKIGGGGETQPPKEQEPSSGPGWKFLLESARIGNGHIRVKDEKSGQTLEASLEVQGAFRDGMLQVRTFGLRTPRSTVTLAGSADLARPNGNIAITLNVPSLALKELATVLDRPIPDETVSASITVSGSSQHPTADFRVNVTPRQEVQGTVAVQRGETLQADLTCTFGSILLGTWTPAVSGEVNGKVTGRFEGKGLGSMKGNARVEVTDSTVGGYNVEQVLIAANLSPGLAGTVEANVSSSLGKADLSAAVKLAGAMDEKQGASGTIRLKAAGVDLTGLKPEPIPVRVGDLNLNGSFNKEPGAPLMQSRVKANLSADDCTFREARVRKARVEGTYGGGSFTVEQAEVLVDGGRVAFKGSGEIRGDVNGSLSLHLGDLAQVTAPFMTEPVKGSADGAFTISGKTLRPVVDGQLDARNVSGPGVTMDDLSLKLTGRTEELATTVDLTVKKGVFQTTSVPSLTLSGRVSPQNAEMTLKGSLEPSGTVELAGSVTGLDAERKEIVLSRLRAGLKGSIWEAREPVKAAVSSNAIELRSFALSNGKQSVNLHGTISLEGESDFTASLKNILLAENLQLAGMEEPPHGQLTADLHVTGKPDAPLVKVEANVTDVQWRENKLSSVSVNVNYADKTARIDGAVLAPDGNRLDIAGTVPVNLALRAEGPRLPSSGLNLNVKGRKVNLAFAQGFTPVIKKLQAVMNVDLRIVGDPRKPDLSGNLSLDGKEIELQNPDVSLRNVAADVSFDPSAIDIKAFSGQAGKGTFDVSGTVKHREFIPRTVDVSVKTRQAPLPVQGFDLALTSDLRAKGDIDKVLDVTGTLHVEDKGHGLDWSTLRPMAVTLADDTLRVSSLTLSQKDQQITAKGTLSLKGTNDFSLGLKNIRAGELLKSFAKSGRLPEGGMVNADVRVTGKAESPVIKADVDLADLTWQGKQYGFSDVNLKVDYADKKASLSGEVRAKDGNTLSLKGTVPVDLALRAEGPRLGSEGMDVRVAGDKVDLNFVAGLVPAVQTLDARVTMHVRATGNPTAPMLNGNASLEGTKLELNGTDYSIGPFAASASFTPNRIRVEKLDATLGGQGKLDLKGTVELKNYQPETVEASLTTRQVPLPVKENLPSLFTSDLTVRGPVDSLSLEGTLHLTSQSGEGSWRTQQPLAVTVKPDAVTVRSLSLISGKQTVSVSGALSLRGANDFHVRVAGLDVKDTLTLAGTENPPSGTLNVDADVTGTADAPAIKADVGLRSASYAAEETMDLTLTIRYADRRARVSGTIQAAKGGAFTLQGVVPVNLAFTAQGDRLPNAGLDVSLRGDSVDLGFLPGLVPEVREAKATLTVDMKATGNPRRPSILGNVALNGEKLQLAHLKQPVRQLVLKSTFGANRVRLEEFSAHVGDKGRISAGGTVSLTDYRPTEVDLNIKADDVPVDYGGDLKTVLSMEIKGSGPPRELSVKGDVTLTDGEVRVDRITERADRNVVIVDTEVEGEQQPRAAKKPPDIYKGMKIRVHVIVPGRMWVRGIGTNIEMKGDLRLAKDSGGDLRINGQINTVRGFYEYAEKVFTIKSGTVTFIALKEPDPNLDITAVYKINTVQIFCNITGTASKPVVKLTSDPVMDDSDIIAYLLFGRPVSNLSRSQASNLQSTAATFIGGLVAKNLKDILGGPFNFDIVQYQGGTSGLAGGSLELGKYVAPHVFMTYRRKFGENGGNEVAVEYEITDHFGIESQIGDDQTTGADLIWRYKY